jgi:hypothetical protein
MDCRLLAAGVLFILGLMSAPGRADEPAKKLSDAEITKLVVGKWYEERKGEGMELKGTTTYRKDGTFSGEATLKLRDESHKVSVTGTWKVADGSLIETVEACDPPILKKGHVSTDQVLAVTAKALKLKEKSGKEMIKTRIAE